MFVPVSSFTRSNLKDKRSEGSWFQGKTLLEYLDAFRPMDRVDGSTYFLPLEASKADEDGVQVTGTIMQGRIKPGTKLLVMPSQQDCTVNAVVASNCRLNFATAGELVTLKLSGPPSGQVVQGEVLCMAEPVRCVAKFKASLQFLESSRHFSIAPGFRAVLHTHAAVEECELSKVSEAIDLETKEKHVNPQIVKPNTFILCVLALKRPWPLAAFIDSKTLGRFVVRVESQTIAVGKVTELPKARLASQFVQMEMDR